MISRISRRACAALALGALLAGAASSAHADWRDQYKQLSFGISSAENERDAVARYDRFASYLSKRLGVPVHVVWGTDYAAVIEALNADKVQFAKIGAANYALGRKVMGDKIAPIAVDEDNYGSTGYHSVIVVKTDSPYRKIADLKGKVLAWADPNSTSGYAVPLYFMKKQGIDPATFFAKTPFSGSHELGVIGVVNGTFDAAADDWTNANKSNALRMQAKGMVPKGSTRIIWTSGLIPNAPYVMRTDLPADLKRAYVDAIMALPKEAPAAFRDLGDGLSKTIAPVTDADYADIVAITQANDRDRRER
jgi:phosphonate transport system substrate-binding protein